MGFIMKPERPKSPFLWEVTPKEISAYVESLEVLVSFLLDKTEALTHHVVEQAQEIAEQSQKITALDQKVEKLEARLNKNSSNSNQPPSSDSPFKKPAKSGSSKAVRQEARRAEGPQGPPARDARSHRAGGHPPDPMHLRQPSPRALSGRAVLRPLGCRAAGHPHGRDTLPALQDHLRRLRAHR